MNPLGDMIAYRTQELYLVTQKFPSYVSKKKT